MKKVLLLLFVAPMTAQAGLLEWLTDNAKEEIKGTLPTKTKETVDRLEFAGTQEFRLLDDTTNHVAKGFLGDPSDSDTAARWLDDDKKFYERRREQNVEIALEYAPQFVKDTASFFGSINDRVQRLAGFVSGRSSSEFEGDFGANPGTLGSATRYWEQKAAMARQAEAAFRNEDHAVPSDATTEINTLLNQQVREAENNARERYTPAVSDTGSVVTAAGIAPALTPGGVLLGAALQKLAQDAQSQPVPLSPGQSPSFREQCRADIAPRVQQILEECPIDTGSICSVARGTATCYRQVASAAAACPSVVNDALDAANQADQQAAEACTR